MQNENLLISMRHLLQRQRLLLELLFAAFIFLGEHELSAGICQRLAPSSVGQDENILVELRVSPAIDEFAYKIVEFIPTSVSVVQITGGGVLDAQRRTLTWRAFSDGNSRNFRYVVQAAGGVELISWSGTADFDGAEKPIIGTALTRIEQPVYGEVFRAIPAEVTAGQLIDVELNALPSPGSLFWTIEETISSGEIIAANESALFLNSRTVRWGPFTSDTPRKLTYQIQTSNPANDIQFRGTGFFNSETSGVMGPSTLKVKSPEDYLIRRTVDPYYKPGVENLVRIDLILPENPGLYAVEERAPAGWKVTNLSEPSRIVDGNRIIWGPLTEGGQQQISYSLTAPEGFLNDINLQGFLEIDGQLITTAGTAGLKKYPETKIQASRSLNSEFRVGEPFEIRLDVQPTPVTGLYRIQEQLPTGWSFIDADIVASLAQGTIRFGPFFDSENRVITYSVLPSMDSASITSFDGSIQTTEETIAIQGLQISKALPPPSGSIHRIQPESYLPGREIELINQVRPDPEVTFFVIEQFIPDDWEIISAEPNYNLGQSGRRMVWGPYADNSSRDLRVTLKAPANALHSADFPVNAFFDGIEVGPSENTSVPVNLPPTLPRIDTLSFAENSEIELRIPVSDPETQEEQLQFNLVWNNTTLFDPAFQTWELDQGGYLVKLNPAPDSYGLARFTMELSDGAYQIESKFSVQILEVNDPPEIKSPTAVIGAIEDASRIIMKGLSIADRDAGAQPVSASLMLPDGCRWLRSSGLIPNSVSQVIDSNELLLSGSIADLNPILNELEWAPARNLFGTVPVLIIVNDEGATGPGGPMETELVFEVEVQPVNDPPVFESIGPDVVIQVWENALRGETVFEGFVKNILPGPNNEVDQTLRPLMQISNKELFAIQPLISRNGNLSFQLAENQFGESLIRFSFQDSGGLDNGGGDTSMTEEFLIRVEPVNRPPSAVPGVSEGEIRVNTSNSQRVEIQDFLTQISAGSEIEDQSGQLLDILVRVNHPEWFIEAPGIDSNGTLMFHALNYIKGVVELIWTLRDDGPGFSPHSNTSEPGALTIVFEAENSPPLVKPGGPVIVFPDSLGPVGWVNGVYAGVFELLTDDIDLEASSAHLQWTSLADGTVSHSVVTLERYELYQQDPYPGLGVIQARFPTWAEVASAEDLRLVMNVVDLSGASSEVTIPVIYYTQNDSHWKQESFEPDAAWTLTDFDSGLPIIQALEDSDPVNLALDSLYPSVPGRENADWIITQGERSGKLYNFNAEFGTLDLLPDQFGNDKIQLTMITENSRVDWAFQLEVDPVPDAPRLDPVLDTTIPEGEVWVKRMTGFDPDNIGVPLRFELLEGPAGLTMDASGNIQWNPSEAQGPGKYQVRFQAGTIAGERAVAEFTIRVLEVNKAPYLSGQFSYSIMEHERWFTDLKIMDPDWPAQSVDVRLLSGPHGIRIQRISAAVVRIYWRPDEIHGGQTWPVVLEIVDDGTPPFNAYQPINISVVEVNDRPGFKTVALSDDQLGGVPLDYKYRVAGWLETEEDTPVVWEISGVDPEQDAMTYQITKSAQHGSIILEGSTLTYNPHPDYYGQDSFLMVSRDEQGLGDVHWVGVTILPVKDIPILQEDILETDFQTILTFSAADLLVNDRFVDGEELIVTLSRGLTFGQINSVGDQAWSYTPPSNFSGSETLEYFVQSQSFYRVGRLYIQVLEPNNLPNIDEITLNVPGGRRFEFNLEELLSLAVGSDGTPDAWQVISSELDWIHDWNIRPLQDGIYEMIPPALGGRNQLRFQAMDPTGQTWEIHLKVEAEVMTPRIEIVNWASSSGRVLAELSGVPGWNWILEQSISLTGPWQQLENYASERTLEPIMEWLVLDFQSPGDKDSITYFWKMKQIPPETRVTIELRIESGRVFILVEGEANEKFTIQKIDLLQGTRLPWLKIEMDDDGRAKILLEGAERVEFLTVSPGW